MNEDDYDYDQERAEEPTDEERESARWEYAIRFNNGVLEEDDEC